MIDITFTPNQGMLVRTQSDSVIFGSWVFQGVIFGSWVFQGVNRGTALTCASTKEKVRVELHFDVSSHGRKRQQQEKARSF